MKTQGVLVRPVKKYSFWPKFGCRANFLASRDECPGSLCHSPTVGVRVGVRVCAWTKTLTLAITFLPEEIGLSYYTCVLLVTRPSTWYHNYWPCDLDLELWPTFKKTLTFGITFLPEVIGLSYCTYVLLVTKPFTLYHNFLPRDLDLEVWPTFEKL